MFGGNVGRDAGVAGEGTDRRIVNDGATALLLHLANFVLHTRPHTAQVNVNNPVPFFNGAVSGRDDFGHDTGVVKGDIEMAKLGYSAVDQGGNLCFVADIAGHGENRVTGCGQFFYFFTKHIFAVVGEDNAGAGLGKCNGGCQAHA